jgi:hypothetical protein
MVYEVTVYEDTVYKDTVYEDTAYEDTVYEDTVYEDTAYEDTAYKDMFYEDTVCADTVYEGLHCATCFIFLLFLPLRPKQECLCVSFCLQHSGTPCEDFGLNQEHDSVKAA